MSARSQHQSIRNGTGLITSVVRSLGVVAVAGLAATGCGTPDPQSGGAAGTTRRGIDAPAAERSMLPAPQDPGIRLTSEGFPITVRPVGVEVSPSLTGEPADPGETMLGIMVEYRGETRDRPTPSIGFTDLNDWSLLTSVAKHPACDSISELDENRCVDGVGQSALFDEHTSNAHGMRQFRSKLLEEHVDGDMSEENLRPGMGYFIEYFAAIPESMHLADIDMCAVVPDEAVYVQLPPARDCFGLGDLPELPRRG